MPGDNPYQPPQSLQEPDENRALLFTPENWKKVLLLFASPTALAAILALATFHWSFLGPSLVIPILFGLGANWKLSTICAEFYQDVQSQRSVVIGIWFVMWIIAQMLLALFTFAIIGQFILR